MLNRILLTAVLSTLGACAAGSSTTAQGTLEDLLAKVASYRVGDQRTALVELAKLVVVASAQPGKAAQVEQGLIGALQGQATLEGKDQLCRHLMLIGSAAAVPALAGMLGSAETADMARYALERIRGEAVNPALRAMLSRTSGRVQIGIVNTLGRRGDTGSVVVLRELILGSDGEVAQAAAAALGQIAGETALAALAAVRPKTSGELRTEVGRAYLRCAEEAARLGNRKAAFAIFKQLSASSEPEAIRVGALHGLAMSGGREAVPLLRAAIQATERGVQTQAIRQLSSIPGPEATTALTRALAGQNTPIKVRILAALADRGDKAALPVLVKAARDEAAAVRVAGLEGLGKIGDASTVLLLAGIAARSGGGAGQPSGDEPARQRTGGFPNERQMPQEAGLTEQAAARLSLNRLRGADVDKAILTGIANQEPNVKVELISATAERGMSAATDTLLQRAKDPDRGVRRAAVRALRGTAGPSNVPALIDLLASIDAGADRPEAVRATASALRRSPAASLGPVISAYRSTTDNGLRFSLLSVLAQTGRDESLQILRDALKEDRTEIRRSAILALSEWPSTAPIQDLLEIAKTDSGPVLPVLALQGYIRLVALPSDRSSAETLGMLSEAMRLARRSEEKKAVLSLVQRIYSVDALAMAEAATQDPEIAAEAKMAADQIRRRLAPARKRN